MASQGSWEGASCIRGRLPALPSFEHPRRPAMRKFNMSAPRARPIISPPIAASTLVLTYAGTTSSARRVTNTFRRSMAERTRSSSTACLLQGAKRRRSRVECSADLVQACAVLWPDELSSGRLESRTHLKTWLLRYTRPGSSRFESTSARSRVFQPKGFGVWCCCGRSLDACRPPVASNAASLPTPCSPFCGCSPMLAAAPVAELSGS